ncbi:aldo/keto reductase [Pseudoalteromonas sp. MMG010]|uniref:aldo/keto reductase n=1 Tax=Pseudoalteromonas sp. MMG010 TaxID=2822685 RepID=UPI001B3A7B3E|nr:aldo/keto reductase [Pseudoalteromonas sp. MMG010]MBQ4833895.1 aldo/keto reductase [Pseudoalteromonas sp. MMG010]
MFALPLDHYLKNVSRIGFGCMGLGGGWNTNAITNEDIKQAHTCIDTALECGINFFDHSDIYSHSKAEQVFGKVLEHRPELRDKIYIQSKCGIRFEDSYAPKRYDLSAQWIKHSLEGSLKRLNTDYLDIYLLHRPDPLMQVSEIAELLNALQHSGKVRHFGVSNMQQYQISALQNELELPLVVNQIEASLKQHQWVDEGIYAGNSTGKDINFTPGCVEYCRHNNIQIQSWGSLCQGVYSGANLANATTADINTSLLVNKLAAIYGTSAETIVIAWLLRHPSAIQPIIGTTNTQRIIAASEGVNITLTREHWYALYVSAKGQELP